MPRYTRPTARTSLIAEIPHDERPRERLLRKGPQSLSDAELVAILLRNGRLGAGAVVRTADGEKARERLGLSQWLANSILTVRRQLWPHSGRQGLG